MKNNSSESINAALSDEELQAIQKILVDELGVKAEQLEPSASLDADLGADSLTKVEIIMGLEERFQVTVPDELAEQVSTVEDVYETVARALGR